MKKYRRKNSLRLQGYDYSQAGAYFITALAYRRMHHFAEIVDGESKHSDIGEIVDDCWHRISDHFANVETDVFVVMPNHIHGTIFLHDDVPTLATLSQVVNTYKGAVTRLARKQDLYQKSTPLWQRNFHERIIRDKREYEALANYILTNPTRWESDSYY